MSLREIRFLRPTSRVRRALWLCQARPGRGERRRHRGDGGRLIAEKGAGAGCDADEPAQGEVSWCVPNGNGHTAASVDRDAPKYNHPSDAAQTDPAEARARRCGGLPPGSRANPTGSRDVRTRIKDAIVFADPSDIGTRHRGVLLHNAWRHRRGPSVAYTWHNGSRHIPNRMPSCPRHALRPGRGLLIPGPALLDVRSGMPAPWQTAALPRVKPRLCRRLGG